MKTTAEKIAVMQACERGEQIESVALRFSPREWKPCQRPNWNWMEHDYRVAVQPPRVWWLNEYPGGPVVIHASRQAADARADEHRERCTQVVELTTQVREILAAGEGSK